MVTTNITVFNTGGISKDAKRSGIPMITTFPPPWCEST